MTAPTPAPMDSTIRPRLRPGLTAVPHDGQIVLIDPLRIGGPPQLLTPVEFEAVQLFTGDRTLRDIQIAIMARLGGVLLPVEALTRLAARLDEALFLDSPFFRDYVLGPVRRPACIGCYPPEPEAIHPLMRSLFISDGGPGRPAEPKAPLSGRLRAVLVPHMDYARGGVTYGWGFKELFEQTNASLFVIIATSHYSPHRFTLTRMNFLTPLGLVETDQTYVQRIADEYGDGVFDDPFAHLPEHSIELEVVMLQHLYAGRKPFRIVPLLVGSFNDCVEERTDPAAMADISRMVATLRKVEAAAGEEVCYVISGDLAHIGPKFHDPEPVTEPWLAQSQTQDERILDRLAAVDAAGFFTVIAEEGDRRRICGLPPVWLTLTAAQPSAGRVLHYNRFVHPTGQESVSFAAAAFYAGM
jgi:AmmeMemoRadiSam system protein B